MTTLAHAQTTGVNAKRRPRSNVLTRDSPVRARLCSLARRTDSNAAI